MFTCLNDIKINTDDYIEKYKNNFNSLINQKDKNRSHKIDIIMSKIRDEKIFEIGGSDDFKGKIYDNIKEMLKVKPGRLLIKELIKLAPLFPEEPIYIENGKRAFHNTNNNASVVEINLNECSDDYYNALAGSAQLQCSKPKAITLAHELIHVLHKRAEEIQEAGQKYQAKFKQVPEQYPLPNWLKDMEIYPNPMFRSVSLEGFEKNIIFKNLSNLEEEHTILGINTPRFLKKKKSLDRLDILSENAFLCAFNLLPRIDHKECSKDSSEENCQMNSNHLSSYYQWLTLQLNERNDRAEKAFARCFR